MPITDQLPTQEEVQKEFDAASQLGVSPCMWVPPEWEDLEIESGKRFLRDNSADDEPFKNPKASDDAQERIKKGNAKKAPQSPESLPNKENWTNAFADFSHIDDFEFPNRSLDLVRKAVDPQGDVQKIDRVLTAVAGVFRDMRDNIVSQLNGDKRLFETALKVLEGKAAVAGQELEAVADVVKNPGAVHDVVQKVAQGHDMTFQDVVSVLRGTLLDLLGRRNALNRLQRIVGADSPGMKRLALVYDWALYRTTELMEDLNKALATSQQQEYQAARDNYLQFLRDLDDHEAEKNDSHKLDPKDKKSPSGYGKALKWACIDPVIFGGQIVGARVIIRWNPHSSSNGVPIPHK